jgi:hypothetical protein
MAHATDDGEKCCIMRLNDTERSGLCQQKSAGRYPLLIKHCRQNVMGMPYIMTFPAKAFRISGAKGGQRVHALSNGCKRSNDLER